MIILAGFSSNMRHLLFGSVSLGLAGDQEDRGACAPCRGKCPGSAYHPAHGDRKQTEESYRLRFIVTEITAR